jgi:transposase-like protein/ribosomal protein L37AE/L43A
MKTLTIKSFQDRYPDDDACLNEIFQNRYGSLKVCPVCNKETHFYKVANRKCYACQYCGHQLHPLAKTIFHKSDTSLKNWFFAIFLFANSKNGVAAKELQRQLGVTYKCAWRMAKQIRLLFNVPVGQLSNTVEVDETYVGGKAHGKRGRGAENKTPVFGMVERGGKIFAEVVGNTKSSTITPLVRENVEIGSTLMTDEYPVYDKLSNYGYKHKEVNHSAKQYVKGNVHTNTIEGFWSQLKRSINGTYHAVSPKYLQNYVNEFSYRYETRHYPDSLFSPILLKAGKRV